MCAARASQQRRLPLAGNYPLTAGASVASLVPFIICTAAFEFFRNPLLAELHATPRAGEVINSLATAGYAFGALVGGDVTQRFPQRALFFFSEGLYVVGAIVAALAPGVAVFGSGYVLQGLATGLLLVVALPPVIQQFPAAKLPLTAALIDVGFFGGITLGPLLGGLVGATGAWRPFFGSLAVLGLGLIGCGLVTLPRKPAPDPRIRFDWTALVLGLVATALSFLAVGMLTGGSFGAALFVWPFAVGIVAFVALLVFEYHASEPLSPVKPMWTTYPVIGVLIAMLGGGAYFTLLLLAQELLVRVQHHPVEVAGALFWPQVVGAIVSSVCFGLVVRTRLLVPFAAVGICSLIGAELLLLSVSGGAPRAFPYAAALLGFGAGATVAPGLWFASLSLHSKLVGRIFALVELVRSEANFVLAPIVVALVVAWSAGPNAIDAAAISRGILLTLAVTALLCVVSVALFVAGGARVQRPDLERWHDRDEPAWETPALLARARSRRRAR